MGLLGSQEIHMDPPEHCEIRLRLLGPINLNGSVAICMKQDTYKDPEITTQVPVATKMAR